MGVINDSKYKAFKISLNNIEHAYELYAAQNNIEQGTEIDISKLPLDSKNLKGKVFLNGEGKVELKEVTDGTYSAEGTLDDLSILKGTVEDLLANRLDVEANITSTSNSILVIVKIIDGVPTSYSYQITEPDDYKQEINNIDKNTYTFDKLKIDTEYSIKVIVKNKAGLTKEITKSIKTEKIENPSISIIHIPSNASLTTTNGYSKEEVAKVTFSNKNITNPTYYIKSTLNGTTNVNVLASCTEENSKPKTCTNASTNAIKANTWYKVSGDINVTYSEETNTPATIYAITFDETNYSNSSTGTTLKIDKVGPTYKATVSEKDVTIIDSLDDKSGLHETAYSCDGVWQKSNVCKFTTTGNHTVNVRDASENEGTAKTINILVTSPYLGSLTPVEYKNNNWIVSDTTTKWYDYDKQQWANAVILNDGINKTVGETVTVEGDNPEAIAMFVWIPRYEYKIDGLYGKGGISAESPGEIEVNFISKDTVYENTNSSGYRVHPVFWWDNNSNGNREAGEELSGIWIGKFETSHTTLSASTENNNLECVDNNCENADGLRILPNVESLRYNDISNFFYAAQSMDNRLSILGDLHMIKNSEWGAVAYLSQSKYGKYGYDKKEIVQNSSAFITGNGDYIANTAQSTTGNITGIYDMSGGGWEFVMGVLNKDISTTKFKSLPYAKYYDNYTSSTLSKACNGIECYGHALSETSNWYTDWAYCVSSVQPWFSRGASYVDGIHASIFGSGGSTGASFYYETFRIALVPTT